MSVQFILDSSFFADILEVNKEMIDTVKFKIKVSDRVIRKIKRRSVEYKKTSHIDDSQQFHFFNCPITIPSYSRGINIFHDIYKENYVYIEFSIPKFIYGHNLFLIDSQQAIDACRNLYEILVENFGEFTSYKEWVVTRLDLCYTWALHDYSKAVSLLGVIRRFEYPRKSTLNYGTSIYSHSTYSTVKYYLKKDEFKRNDFGAISKYSPTKAIALLSLSSNLLRFEVELRKRTIASEFENIAPLLTNLFKDSSIFKILNKYFYKSMDNNISIFNNNDTVYSRILKYTRNSTSAIHLYEFYTLLHSDIKEDRIFLKTTYSASSFRRKKKLLRDIGIGLYHNSNDFDNFSFNIPSINNVNNFLLSQDSPSVSASVAGRPKSLRQDY